MRPVLTTDSEGRHAAPNLYETDAENYLQDHALGEEVFGPLGLVVRVSGAEFLVDVQARYVTPDGRPFRFSKAESFAVLTGGAIGASIYYGSDADAMDIDLLPDPAVSAEIVVAVGTDDWVSVGDLSLEAALALAGRGRIEGGVGFLGGVVTKRFPFVPGVGPFPPPYSGLPFVPCVPER